jgi:hypothetical protein
MVLNVDQVSPVMALEFRVGHAEHRFARAERKGDTAVGREFDQQVSGCKSEAEKSVGRGHR